MTVEKVISKLTNLPLQIKSAFFAALLAGIMTHGYILTNKFTNADDAWNVRAYGGSFSMGRWVTGGLGPVVSKFCGNYSNPWVTGSLSLLLLAIAACFIVEALEVKKVAASMVIAAIMVSFPSITANLLYGFMAAYFSLGILLASVSVWLIIRFDKIYWMLLGIFLLSCSMGLYQAYFPFAASILLIALIKECLNDKRNAKEMLFRSLRFLVALVCGMILYFLINSLCLVVFKETMSAHKNLNSMGQIEITAISGIVVQMYRNMVKMLTNGYMGMSSHVSIRILIAVCWLAVLAYSLYRIWRLKKSRQYGKIALGVFFLLIFPIAINLIDIMCANSPNSIYLLMTYSLCCIFILPAALLDSSERPSVHWGVLLAGAMTVFYYFNLANTAYICVDLSQRSIESFYTTLITQIKSEDGYTADTEIVFVGEVQDPTLYPLTNEFGGVSIPTVVSNSSKANYTREGLLKYYCGFYPTYAEDYGEENKAQIDAMPCYPDDGSIQIVGGRVVVKLSEERR